MTRSASETMLQVRGLRHAYAASPEHAYPDFDAPAGATVLLRGPSGSGKSTLLALLAGLLRPSAGRMVVAGTDITALDARRCDAWRGATLGFVPQRLHLSPGLTVRGNLELPYLCTGRAVDAARIAAVLGRLGLQGLALRRPPQLSVGQAQRVAMARALLLLPRLVLADEPTAHLDDDSARAVLALLGEMAREAQAGLLVATHDARVAQGLDTALHLELPARAIA